MSGTDVARNHVGGAESPLPDDPSPREVAEVEDFWVLVELGLIWLPAVFGRAVLVDAGTFRISFSNAGSCPQINWSHRTPDQNVPSMEKACLAAYTRSPPHAFLMRILGLSPSTSQSVWIVTSGCEALLQDGSHPAKL